MKLLYSSVYPANVLTKSSFVKDEKSKFPLFLTSSNIAERVSSSEAVLEILDMVSLKSGTAALFTSSIDF